MCVGRLRLEGRWEFELKVWDVSSIKSTEDDPVKTSSQNAKGEEQAVDEKARNRNSTI